ncbi:MAG: RrF2 family transcriptional regulator [Anaerolineae bacterium]|nr:RrF2 family transcriptional regulator [Anaerolineae bacterium]
MKLTARERYAVRAMAILAGSYGSGPRSLAEVANEQGIPFRYLEHIAQDLKRAGLVRSHRGASGGYELAHPPESITVADVLRALEGDVLPMECGTAPNCFYHDRVEACVTRPLWRDIRQQIQESLSQVTLASVAGRLRLETIGERSDGDGI